MLVQGEDGRCLCVGEGAQFVEEQGECVFVVGDEGGERGVVCGQRGDCGFGRVEARLQRAEFGGAGGCWEARALVDRRDVWVW